MSFLRNYLTYASRNEAPDMFHVWGAYFCLSAAISRRVWIANDDYVFYPNLYILYIGGAANGKSVALQKAKKILKLVNLPISASIETHQGLLRFMTGSPDQQKPIPPYGGNEFRQTLTWPNGEKKDVFPMSIVANEFINFISLDDLGWISMLNDIYDEDYYLYRTKGQGQDSISGPYITMLGALTTEVSAELQKTRIINTGLARRTLMQYGERDWNNPHSRSVETPEQKQAFTDCIAWLKNFPKISGAFTWTKETGEWYDKWYAPNLASVPSRPLTQRGWYGSRHVQLLKIAMLTSLSERTDLVLEVSHLELALSYLERLESDFHKIFGGIGRNDLAPLSHEIYTYIANLTEPIAHKTLLLVFWKQIPGRRDRNKEFEECITFLSSDGRISVAAAGVSIGSGYNDYVYATPEVMSNFLAKHAGVVDKPVVATASVLRPEKPNVVDP